jgi:hypothetical protein
VSRLERATAGYDPAFETELTDAVIRTIVEQSMIDNVLVLRTGESAAALVGVLAVIMAMSPAAAHNEAAIKQVSRSFRRKLSAQVHHARQNPDLHEFLRRSFNYSDRERGGNA